MHKCLQIPEILLQIFAQISPKPHDSRSTLAALARTCSLFFDVAADLLWAPRDLRHLVMLMPRDLWSRLSESGSDSTSTIKFPNFNMLAENNFEFCRPMEPSDLNSFLRYSHRIQSFSTSHGVPGHVLKSIKNTLPSGAKPFPSIRSITIFCKNDDIDIIPSLLVGPALRQLTISGREEIWPQCGSNFKLLLRKVAQNCQDLSAIHILVEGSQLSTELSEPICDFVCKYKSLARGSIDINGITPSLSLIRHVASLHSLHFLRWSPAVFALDQEFVPSLGLIEGFHYGTKGTPTEHSLAGFISFIELLVPRTKVPEIRLRIPCSTTVSEITRTIELLSERWCHETLRSIDFQKPEQVSRYACAPTCVKNPHLPLSFNALAPLLSFRNLKRVVLYASSTKHGPRCTFGIDDDELITMGDSWPALECLAVETSGFKITLRGLLGFFKGCPKLSFLSLDEMDFNTESYTLPDDMSTLSQFPELRDLYVSNSRTDNGEKILELFLHIFPGLSMQKFGYGDTEDNYWSWRVVEKGLPVNFGPSDLLKYLS